jgi:hypothetical protein
MAGHIVFVFCFITGFITNFALRSASKSGKVAGRDSDSSGSDLDDAASALPKAPATAASHSVPSVVPPASHMGPGPSTGAVTPKEVPPMELVPKGTAPATSTAAPAPARPVVESHQGATKALREDKPTSVAPVPPTVSPPKPAAPHREAPPVDLVRLLDSTADAAHSLWQGLLKKYRLPRSHAADAFSDSKILLRHICVPWIRLGHQMLRDAHSAETPKGTVECFLAVEIITLGHVFPACTLEMRKALKGLERCARIAVQAVPRRAKKLLGTTSTEDLHSPVGKKTALDGCHALNVAGGTSFGKKFTHSKLGSTAFPDSEVPQGGDHQAAGAHVHRSQRAVGAVFGLALVQRLFHRYGSTDAEDKTQLLVSTCMCVCIVSSFYGLFALQFLLNKVNHGDLPITEISRDNLRDFLDSHIGIDLSWAKVCVDVWQQSVVFFAYEGLLYACCMHSQFDSVCQRLDPDRNGFISASSVTAAFEQLSPLADKLPPSEATFTALFLLSVATDTLVRSRIYHLVCTNRSFDALSTPIFRAEKAQAAHQRDPAVAHPAQRQVLALLRQVPAQGAVPPRRGGRGLRRGPVLTALRQGHGRREGGGAATVRGGCAVRAVQGVRVQGVRGTGPQRSKAPYSQ